MSDDAPEDQLRYSVDAGIARLTLNRPQAGNALTPDQRDRIIALHGRSLTFLHPIRYEPISVTAPLPEVWGELQLPLAQ